MARLLLVALCIACASAFSPPATLAPRTVVARTASVEMGARGKSQAQRGNINLLKKPSAKKAAPKRGGKVAASRRSPHCCRRQQLPCYAPPPAQHAGFSPVLHPTDARSGGAGAAARRGAPRFPRRQLPRRRQGRQRRRQVASGRQVPHGRLPDRTPCPPSARARARRGADPAAALPPTPPLRCPLPSSSDPPSSPCAVPRAVEEGPLDACTAAASPPV